MNGLTSLETDYLEFVEVDPTGRYRRYNEILGKGASKTVYKAFDEYEGIEVAWNQVRLCDSLQRPEDLERLYCEIHLLKTLNHENIMKFYTSWVDTANRNINFVTEMFTSGTLRQYRLKHRRVNIRAVKHWCRQILKGLLYLHSHDPPVIHRDLKCDNIFVNGNQGEVKIGDLGLAAILKKSYAAHCVGTPEFMAPEVYEEEYNELVDIYSFGMCVLEMVTFDYPYSECNHAGQIYKKVVSGKKPDSLFKVKDPDVRQFVEKCLATVSARLSARELLNDPFLLIDDCGFDLRPIDYDQGDLNGAGPLVTQPLYGIHCSNSSLTNGYTDYLGYDLENEIEYHQLELETSPIDLFICQEDEHLGNVDIAIKGRWREDDGIFLRLRVADKEGHIRNIYFPFDIETDTGFSVATEMFDELGITDQDVLKIADMIDGEISTLVPEWKRGLGIQQSPQCTDASFCQNCASHGNLLDYFSSNSSGTRNLEVLPCSKHGCAAVHGRFEEITYQVKGPEQSTITDCAPVSPSQSTTINCTDIWAQRNAPNSQGSREIHCGQGHIATNHTIFEEQERIVNMDTHRESSARKSTCENPSAFSTAYWDDYENEIRQELRWLKAKYQMQLRELKDQQLGVKSKTSSLSPNSHNMEHQKGNVLSLPLMLPKEKRGSNEAALKFLSSAKNFTSYFPTDADERCADSANTEVQNCEEINKAFSPEQMITAKNFYAGALLPHTLHRATSLPVDAVDV
ncbi:PREDICTED: probable serine/threonine-protein kinase WNK9 isoform X1 [Populus euphratica]|uniref:non-specific serine/threonine protein kinase n=2 Tax=Populus euphratica TaxID=75702 RepID=A0AAJ6UBX8_POPEU|nr:PREDICTED: probable serine/threonine-protein kinase WNK9 isoform X1 [Populus euphratica]